MSGLQLAVLAGALIGLGVYVLVMQLAPAAPPDLKATLAQLDAPPAPRTTAPAAARNDGLAGAVGGWLARHGRERGVLSVPVADLKLLGRDVEQFMLQKVMAAAIGVALPSLLWALATVLGLGVPFVIPAIAALGAGWLLWVIPSLAVRDQAADARTDFRRALSAYLDLVALERAGSGSPVEALQAAARVGQGWVFVRIQDRLVLAERQGITPWVALAELSDDVGVSELRDLADIVAVAADGAAIYDTLLVKSRSLRNAQLSEEEAAANAQSERLVYPVVLLGIGFILMLFYPAMVRLLGYT